MTTAETIKTPRHVAIIMDGNGRWANARGLPRVAGHKAGVESVRRTLEAVRGQGVEYLTLFGFSAENWRRPLEEVDALMNLLRFYLRGEMASLHKEGVRLRVIGDRSRLSSDIVGMIEQAEGLTRDNVALNLKVALSYGGRQEIVEEAKRIAAGVERGDLSVDQIDEAALTARLFTHDIPDPDLVIRTSGEKRISNFLLWQSAYAEFVFTETMWPDFCEKDLLAAIEDFRQRDRRFGATKSSNGQKA